MKGAADFGVAAVLIAGGVMEGPSARRRRARAGLSGADSRMCDIQLASCTLSLALSHRSELPIALRDFRCCNAATHQGNCSALGYYFEDMSVGMEASP